MQGSTNHQRGRSVFYYIIALLLILAVVLQTDRTRTPQRLAGEAVIIATTEQVAAPVAADRNEKSTPSGYQNTDRRKPVRPAPNRLARWRKYLDLFKRQGEIPGRRDAFARHFRNGDGTTTALISPSPIHYRDENGKWRFIDTEIVPTETGFSNEKNPLKSSFPKRSDSQDGTKIGLDGDRWYKWIPQSAGYRRDDGVYVSLWQLQSVAGKVDGDVILYPEIFPSATERYQIHAGVVKHDLILSKPPSVPQSQVADATFDYVGHVGQVGQVGYVGHFYGFRIGLNFR